MTIQDTKVVLNAIQIAYPYFHKGAAPKEMEMTIDLWASSFHEVPVEIVMLALKKIISSNTFAPTPSEVRRKIQQIKCEAIEQLLMGNVTDDQANKLKAIVDSCGDDAEPTLVALIDEGRQVFEALHQQKGSLPLL